MKDGQGPRVAWCTNSDPPHRSRGGCNLSFTECQELPRDVFPQELSHLNGPNFLGNKVLLIIRDAVFWDVSRDLLRLRQRANPLLWPAPAKETMASRCSCRSPVGPGALIGDSLRWSSEAIPCFASTLLPRRAPRQFVSPSTRFGSPRHTPHWWDEFQRPKSAE